MSHEGVQIQADSNADSIHRIFDTQDGAIKLEGDEKTLLASMEQDHAESNPPPANFS